MQKHRKRPWGRVKGTVKAAQDFDAIQLLLTGTKKSKKKNSSKTRVSKNKPTVSKKNRKEGSFALGADEK